MHEEGWGVEYTMWHTVKWWTVTQWYDDSDMLDYVWMTWLTVLKLLSMSRLLVSWEWAIHKKTFWMTWLDISWHKQTLDEKTFVGHEQTLDKSADLCLSHSTVLKRSCEGHHQPQLQSKLEVIKINYGLNRTQNQEKNSDCIWLLYGYISDRQ